jgi:hypothetical protein
MFTMSVIGSAVETGPSSVAHLVGEVTHPRQHGVHFGHHVGAVDTDDAIRAGAQRHMQGGAVFGGVDPLAGEHGRAPGLEPRARGQGRAAAPDLPDRSDAASGPQRGPPRRSTSSRRVRGPPGTMR